MRWLEEIGRASDQAAREALLNQHGNWVGKGFVRQACLALQAVDAGGTLRANVWHSAAEGLSVVAERVGDPASRARTLDLRALFARQTGRIADIPPLAERSSELWSEGKDTRKAAEALQTAGEALAEMEQWERSVAALERGADLYAAVSDRNGEAECRLSVGNALFSARRHEDAVIAFRRAVETYRKAGNEAGVAKAQVNLGGSCLEAGKVDEALSVLEAAFPVIERGDNLTSKAVCLFNLGSAYLRSGRFDEALSRLDRSMSLYASVGDKAGAARSLTLPAEALMLRERYAETVERCRQALPLLQAMGDKHGLAEAMFDLGRCYLATGRATDAIAMDERALALYRDLGDRPCEGKLLNNLGAALLDSGRVEESLQRLIQARSILEEADDKDNLGVCLLNISMAQIRLRQDDALPSAEKALSVQEALGNPDGIAESLGRLCIAYIRGGRVQDARLVWGRALGLLESVKRKAHFTYLCLSVGQEQLAYGLTDEALATAQTARMLATEAGRPDLVAEARLDEALVLSTQGERERALTIFRELAGEFELLALPGGVAECHHQIGQALAGRSEYEEAIASYEEALRLNETLGNKKGMAGALVGIADAKGRSGAFHESWAILERAVVLATESGDRAALGQALRRLGGNYYSSDRLQEALTTLHEASQVSQQAGQPGDAAYCDLDAALVYVDMGLYAEAAALVDRSQAFFEKARCPLGVIDAFRVLADSYRSSQPERALALYERVRHEHRKMSKPRDAARTTAIIGLVHKEMGRHDLARQLFVTARKELAPFSDIFSREAVAWCDMGEADLHRLEHRPDLALPLFVRAQVFLEGAGTRLDNAWCLQQMGMCHQAIGDIASARQAYESALAVLEQRRAGLWVPDLSASSQDDVTGVTGALAIVAISQKDPQAAFRFIQRGKGMTVRQALSGRIAAATDLRPEDAERLRLLRAARDQAEMELATRQAAANPTSTLEARKGLEDVLTARDRAVMELSGFEAVLSARSRLWARREARPATLTQVAQALGNKTAVLEVVADDTSVCLLMVRNRKGQPRLVFHKVPVTKSELNKTVDRFLKVLKEDPDRSKASLPALTTFSRRLFDHLIAPFEKELSGIETLIVCPDGFLHSLPFSALQDSKGKYLIDRFAISTAPSASAWEACRSLSDEHKEGMAPPLVAAVSRFDNRPKLVASLAPTLARRGSALSDLPQARTEAEMVRKALGTDTVMLVNEGATVEAVAKGAPSARLLHFATHAFPNDAFPLQSALVLTPSPERPMGLLYARDIYDMRLSADLAVLSACSTSSGKVTGEGLMGLSWAFLVAGCPRTVASRWDVDDRATRRWMEAFYRSYAGENQGSAEAVRQAALALLRTKGTKQDDSSPHHWAAWTLIGNDR